MNNRQYWQSILKKYGIVGVFILLFLFLSFSSPAFFTTINLMNVVRQVAVIGIISIGVTYIIITRGIDLSSGSLIAILGLMAASMVRTEVPLVLIFPLIIAAGAFFGAVNGSLVAWGKIPPFIATLGMMIGARGIAQLYSSRPIGINPDDSAVSFYFSKIATGSFLGLPLPIWIYFAVAAVAWLHLTRTRFGRHIFAIGGNESAARLCGVKIELKLLSVYVLAGALYGLASIMQASRVASGNPTAGLNFELDAIAATVVGGTSLSGGYGSIPLCVVGALLIGIINNGMDLLGVQASWQLIVKGIIIIGAVLLDSIKNRQKS